VQAQHLVFTIKEKNFVGNIKYFFFFISCGKMDMI
jgi:hypothetical protein